MKMNNISFVTGNDRSERMRRPFAAVSPGGGAFAFFLRPHRGAFGSLSVPTPGEFAIQEKKC